MRNIKNIVMISFLSTWNIYNSDYYLFKFHPELPLHYRAEMFLLDAWYKRVHLEQNNDNKMAEIFERMEYIISRLSFNSFAQDDYQKAVIEYKNKIVALKK